MSLLAWALSVISAVLLAAYGYLTTDDATVRSALYIVSALIAVVSLLLFVFPSAYKAVGGRFKRNRKSPK